MYKVRIDSFEGPFDLLVYLLENAKMDIYDIKVAEITEQYIDYLKAMGDLDVEVSSEFIVLAAVLIRLKSRMLLPRVTDEGEIVFDDDPRQELAARLAEYMQTKKIAEMLQDRDDYYSGIFEKPGEDLSEYIDSPDEILKVDSDQFVNAFLLFLSKKKKIGEVRKRYQRVQRQRASIEERIAYMGTELERRFKDSDEVIFSDLIEENADRYDVTLSFVSLLEMVKKQEVDANQKELYGDITISATKKDVGGSNV